MHTSDDLRDIRQFSLTRWQVYGQLGDIEDELRFHPAITSRATHCLREAMRHIHLAKEALNEVASEIDAL